MMLTGGHFAEHCNKSKEASFYIEYRGRGFGDLEKYLREGDYILGKAGYGVKGKTKRNKRNLGEENKKRPIHELC